MNTPLPINIIPLAAKIQATTGTFTLAADTAIQTAQPELASIVAQLRKTLGNPTNFPFPSTQQKPTSPLILLQLDPVLAHLGPESYRLSVTPQKITLSAPKPAGIFYATQSLLQLLPPAIFGSSPRIDITWQIPCVEIEDAPRFAWRGAMLDSVRHFQPVSFVKKFIDLLALHKLNTFHWHLTDDQGWRIEIKKYPRLTEIGSMRAETCRGHVLANAGGDSTPHGGFYTQEQIRDIVAYAAERHITILPEFNLPGHATAAIAAYPEHGCTGKQIPVETRWGIHENLFNPFPPTLRFLQDIFDEIISLFPGKYIHIGGDEAVKNQWDNSPEIQSLIKSLNLSDSDALQTHFVSQIGAYLIKNGRSYIGWDEIIDGGLPQSAAVMIWRDTKHALPIARNNHDLVMAWTGATYLDYYQNPDISTEPLTIHNVVTLSDSYNFDPVPRELEPAFHKHILGLQGQLWTEYQKQPAEIEYMLFPRLTALSEVAWSPASLRNYPDFRRRLLSHLKRLDILDTRYRPPTD